MDIESTPTEPLPVMGGGRPEELKRGNGSSPVARGLLIAGGIIAALILGVLAANGIAALQIQKVFPDAPSVTVSTECGVEPTVAIPEVPGVIYTQSRSGDLLTVKATPESKEYELIKGAPSKWEIVMGSVACPTPTEETAPDASPEESSDYVGEIIDGTKELGSEAWDWTKEYGPGILDRVKELGTGAKESVEEWSRGSGE